MCGDDSSPVDIMLLFASSLQQKQWHTPCIPSLPYAAHRGARANNLAVTVEIKEEQLAGLLAVPLSTDQDRCTVDGLSSLTPFNLSRSAVKVPFLSKIGGAATCGLMDSSNPWVHSNGF